MRLVQMRENFVNKLQKFKRRFVVELYHAQVLHERWSVKTVNNLLDLGRVEIGCFAE